jgi:hypothetical protein
MNRCLGRRLARHDARTLRFAAYAKDLPMPPAQCNWSEHSPSWPMMLNDNLGDCTIAAAGHLIQEWTANAYGGPGHIVADPDILKAYEAVSGYKPGKPDTDDGAVELDVLNYWRKTGIGGHKIWAFAAVAPRNHVHVQQAAYLFGGLYIGLDLPVAAQAQLDAKKPWDPPTKHPSRDWEPGSWGGHAVPIVAYDQNWLTVVTWGALQKMSWRFLDTYCSETWAVLGGSDWLEGTDMPVAPNGLDLAALQSDLTAVTG